jgi:hypothetical protein
VLTSSFAPGDPTRGGSRIDRPHWNSWLIFINSVGEVAELRVASGKKLEFTGCDVMG